MKRCFSRQSSFGITAVEILVYIGVLAIIVTAVSSLLLLMINSNAKMKTMNAVSIAAQETLDLIDYEIKHARGVYTPTFSNNQLSLFTPRHAPAGEENGYIDFFICDSRVCFKREGENPIALTPESMEVTQLEFFRVVSGIEASSIQIHLRIAYKNPANRPELEASADLTSTTLLRSNEN